MRRAAPFVPMGLALALAGCGPVELRSDADRAVIQYDSHDSTLADATALARTACARYGKDAAFYQLTGDGLNDAFFNCVPQTAQTPPKTP